MGRNWLRSMARREETVAADCLMRLRSQASAGEFGYKIQAIAAHVLLGLNHRVTEVNHKGHPDIVSVKDGREFRFEVEAEVVRRKSRMLSPTDFEGLIRADAEGFFAVAVSFPRPYWVLVPARKLVRRNFAAVNALLVALSDKTFSSEWTREYVPLVVRSCRDVLDRSFDQLVQRAKAGRGL